MRENGKDELVIKWALPAFFIIIALFVILLVWSILSNSIKQDQEVSNFSGVMHKECLIDYETVTCNFVAAPKNSTKVKYVDENHFLSVAISTGLNEGVVEGGRGNCLASRDNYICINKKFKIDRKH